MQTTKEEIIKEINNLDVQRIKLIGALELLQAQEAPKETKEEAKPA
jgi:hypothetical protein